MTVASVSYKVMLPVRGEKAGCHGLCDAESACAITDFRRHVGHMRCEDDGKNQSGKNKNVILWAQTLRRESE